MGIVRVNNTKTTEKLFGDWQETLIWSCLQNIMGDIYAEDGVNPKSAMAILGDFRFYAGKANKELVLFKPVKCRQDFIIMVPQNKEWAELIKECFGEKAKEVTRYAIKKEPDVFDTDRLQQAVDSLDYKFSLSMIDEEIFHYAKETDWARDLVSQFSDYEHYRLQGIGVVAFKEGEMVSGASSYSRYKDGIEIEIDTREDFRRQGLAYACGAKLILECLKRGLYPSWDAQNKWSVALAEKLGYHYDHDYVAYEIYGF